MLRFLAFLLILAPLPALTQESTGKFLTMTGSARIAALPDIIRTRGSVYVEDESAERAFETAKKRMAALGAALDDFGKIRLSRISLGESHSRTKSLIGSDEPEFIARGSVTVQLADKAKAGAVLDALVKAGSVGIAQLEYDIADRAALMTEAREQAAADAIQRAQTYARAADLTLGPILDLTETSSNGGMSHEGPVGPGFGSGSYRGAQGMSGQQAFGVEATVTIRWAIE